MIEVGQQYEYNRKPTLNSNIYHKLEVVEIMGDRFRYVTIETNSSYVREGDIGVGSIKHLSEYNLVCDYTNKIAKNYTI